MTGHSKEQLVIGHNLSVEDATKLALDRPLYRLLTASRAAHWNGVSHCSDFMDMLWRLISYRIIITIIIFFIITTGSIDPGG